MNSIGWCGCNTLLRSQATNQEETRAPAATFEIYKCANISSPLFRQFFLSLPVLPEHSLSKLRRRRKLTFFSPTPVILKICRTNDKMKRLLTPSTTIFLIVVTANTIYGSPLSLIRLLTHNRAYGNGVNNKVSNRLDNEKNYENSISVDDSAPTADINLQDYQQDWTKITKNPVSSLTTTVGNRIELQCEANGSPPPQILWLRGNDPEKQLTEFLGKSMADIEISSDGWEGLGQIVSKLVIECVTPNDQGLIYCASVAGKKVQLSSPTLLLVNGENGNSSCKGENKPTITLHSPMRFALIGSTVVLPCRATGKLRPYTYWLDNNAAVIHSSSNPRHKILRNGDLVIDPLEWTDMGSLTCYAKSDYKEDSVTTFLYPMVDEKKNF